MFTHGDKKFEADPLKKNGVSSECPVVFSYPATHFAGVLNSLLWPLVLFKNKSVDFWFPSVRLPW